MFKAKGTIVVKPAIDHGQELAAPAGRAIGFVDTKDQFEAVTNALKATGYAEPSIIALKGEAGVNLLERLQEKFNFGDGEDALTEFAIKELQAGHYAIGVEAKDRDDALHIASLTEPFGAHSFSYFGTWVNERLTR
jgi:hypothetical protein